MSLLYAATYPARTSALILYGTYARRSWAADYPFGWKDEQWQRLFDNFERHWGTPQSLAVTLFAPSLAGDQPAAERMASYQRASASPGAAIAIMKMNREIDVRHVLPAIRVPTLVVHRTGELVINIAQARYLAQHIPGAKLVELAGVDHSYLAGDYAAVLDEVEVFLTGARHAPEGERVLATVLFVDIAGSTERAAALGDRAWRGLLDTFYDKVRGALRHYRGREIDTAGDGLLAAFDGPARAIRCAGAIRDAVRPLGIEVRCGVHIGARVAGLAAPGEVLVSHTVRDLVAGSGLTFEERGLHTLKGVPQEWLLFRALPE
jgi:class 3 adenylate cyclase